MRKHSQTLKFADVRYAKDSNPVYRVIATLGNVVVDEKLAKVSVPLCPRDDIRTQLCKLASKAFASCAVEVPKIVVVKTSERHRYLLRMPPSVFM